MKRFLSFGLVFAGAIQVCFAQVPEPPPQAAFDACSGQSDGNQCNMQTPRGKMEGTCGKPPNEQRLVCMPRGGSPRGTRRKGLNNDLGDGQSVGLDGVQGRTPIGEQQGAALIGGQRQNQPDVSVCNGNNNFGQIPAVYSLALTKYINTNIAYQIYVCTEDANGDGTADFMVVEASGQPEHESVYYDSSHQHYEDYDYVTNIYKYAPVYSGQRAHSAGGNKIENQVLVMRMPIAPEPAIRQAETALGPIGLALNGVAFFNESAGPGHIITDEIYTFDQCSGHPQNSGIYHYHVDPVCLIRDLGGSVVSQSKTVDGKIYQWLDDAGNNASLLLGFLIDGFAVYAPIGQEEVDCQGQGVPPIDENNGHQHCTEDFAESFYHYHVKTANLGGTHNPIFWISNKYYYGSPGRISQ